MAIGYDGKPLTGYMGVYGDLVEKYNANDPSVTKDIFIQLVKDLEIFLDAHATDGFGSKSPVEGQSAGLGFPEITTSEAQALRTKIKTTILKD
ncbi:MAG: hypothetical protein E3K37_05770 [Candidatus Kuenenia sp.]|nr:hypothetical protein [Candidatus Kuenenia hertensis]